MYSGYLSYIDKIKKDPTNRIRTSDLRKSMINYSPPLYQLSYGRYPIKGHSGIEYVSGDGAKIKTPSPGIEPGAQTWKAWMLPTTPQWIAEYKGSIRRWRRLGSKTEGSTAGQQTGKGGQTSISRISRKSGGYQGRNSQVDIRYLSGIYLGI